MSCGLLQPTLGVNARGSTEGRFIVVRERLSTCQSVTYFESGREMGYENLEKHARQWRTRTGLLRVARAADAPL
jgi:hypothetical protein